MKKKEVDETKIEEIVTQVDPSKQRFFLTEELAFIYNVDAVRLEKVWKKSNGDYVELNLKEIVDNIASYLKDFVDVKALLKEILETDTSPREIIEVAERIEKKPTVKSAPGKCYSLMIGGKKGRPHEFALLVGR